MQDPCSIVGHKKKYFLFDKTGIQHNVTIQGGKGCQLRVLAVGGGGYAKSRYGCSGGGSGFTHFANIDMSVATSPYNIEVEVGDKGQGSSISINGDLVNGHNQDIHCWEGKYTCHYGHFLNDLTFLARVCQNDLRKKEVLFYSRLIVSQFFANFKPI